MLEEDRRRCVANGNLYTPWLPSTAIIGVCKVLQGNIEGGIQYRKINFAENRKVIEALADWYRLFLE